MEHFANICLTCKQIICNIVLTMPLEVHRAFAEELDALKESLFNNNIIIGKTTIEDEEEVNDEEKDFQKGQE